MKRLYTLIIVIILFYIPSDAQKRVVDAETQSPVAAASIFDGAGNMVGFTWSDGSFSKVPESAYPITLRCMGYEQLVIERPEEKTWEMTPIAYELEEVRGACFDCAGLSDGQSGGLYAPGQYQASAQRHRKQVLLQEEKEVTV